MRKLFVLTAISLIASTTTFASINAYKCEVANPLGTYQKYVAAYNADHAKAEFAKHIINNGTLAEGYDDLEVLRVRTRDMPAEMFVAFPIEHNDKNTTIECVEKINNTVR